MALPRKLGMEMRERRTDTRGCSSRPFSSRRTRTGREWWVERAAGSKRSAFGCRQAGMGHRTRPLRRSSYSRWRCRVSAGLSATCAWQESPRRRPGGAEAGRGGSRCCPVAWKAAVLRPARSSRSSMSCARMTAWSTLLVSIDASNRSRDCASAVSTDSVPVHPAASCDAHAEPRVCRSAPLLSPSSEVARLSARPLASGRRRASASSARSNLASTAGPCSANVSQNAGTASPAGAALPRTRSLTWTRLLQLAVHRASRVASATSSAPSAPAMVCRARAVASAKTPAKFTLGGSMCKVVKLPPLPSTASTAQPNGRRG